MIWTITTMIAVALFILGVANVMYWIGYQQGYRQARRHLQR